MLATFFSILLCGLWLSPSPAPAPRVLVLRSDAEVDVRGFVEALRIQLAGRGTVIAGPALAPGALPERVAAAGEAARAAPATLAVWLERAPAKDGGEDVVLYVVGNADGRAVVQVFRLPAGSPADTDRTLALKVGGVLDELLQPEVAVVLAPGPPGPPAVVPSPTPAPASAPTLVLAVDLAAGSSPGDDGWEARGGLLFGVRWSALELDASLDAATGDTWTTAAGEVTTDEYAALFGVRVLGLRALDLSARLALGGRWIAATGRSPGGREGTDVAVVPLVRLVVDKRVPLGAFAVRAGLGVDVTPVAQAFTVNQRPVADLGHVRGFLQLSLEWGMP